MITRYSENTLNEFIEDICNKDKLILLSKEKLYNYIDNNIEEIIDGNIGVSNNLKNTLIKNGIIDGEHNSNERGRVEYYYSGRAVDDAELSHIKELHKRLEVMRKI